MTNANPHPMPLAVGLVGPPGEDLIAHRPDCVEARLTHTSEWVQSGSRPGRVDIAECKGCGRRYLHRVDIELTDRVRPPITGVLAAFEADEG